MSKTVLFQTIQFSIQNPLYFKQFSMPFVKTVLFQAIHFSLSMQFSSIWSMNKTLLGGTSPG